MRFICTSLERIFISQKYEGGALDLPVEGVRTRPDGKKRILLLGLFGCDNHGNEGSLEAMIEFLRRNCPEAELTSVCVDPAKVERDHKIPGIQINWPGFTNPVLELLDRTMRKIPRRAMNVIRTIREVRRFHVVIVPGTGILTDYRADPFGAPYWVFRWCVAARLCGVKLYLVNIGAGPIERKLSRWLLKQAALAASYRSFRDTFSRDFVAGLGVDTSADQIYPDIAFMLPTPQPLPPASEARRLATVGIGVMSYNGWQGQTQPDRSIHEAYLSQLGDFVSWLLQRGHPVRLLVGEITDESVVEELRELIREKHGLAAGGAELFAEPIHSLQDLMQQMALTDIVVASRFHNIVCALKLGRPTISVSYTKKHDELMDRAGLSNFYQPIEQLSLQRLVEQFQELSDNRAMYETCIAERVVEFRRRLTQQDDILLQSIR